MISKHIESKCNKSFNIIRATTKIRPYGYDLKCATYVYSLKIVGPYYNTIVIFNGITFEKRKKTENIIVSLVFIHPITTAPTKQNLQ